MVKKIKKWNQFCRGINFAMYWDHVGMRISQNRNFELCKLIFQILRPKFAMMEKYGTF